MGSEREGDFCKAVGMFSRIKLGCPPPGCLESGGAMGRVFGLFVFNPRARARGRGAQRVMCAHPREVSGPAGPVVLCRSRPVFAVLLNVLFVLPSVVQDG